MHKFQMILKSTAALSLFAFCGAVASAESTTVTTEPSGAAFAHTCAACHGTYGYPNKSAFPQLAGMKPDVFVREMKRFRSKERPSSIMSHIADGYNDRELERMAEFFAALPPKPPAASSTPATQTGK